MKKIVFAILSFLLILFLYGKCIEVNNFKIRNYTINNELIPDSFKDLKIVHFSDILFNSNTNSKYLEDLVDNINNENPDLIVFSGDLFKQGENYTEDDYKLLKNAFNQMEATLYKYAVIGDNDKNSIDEYKDILYEAGFNLLDNENMLLFYKDITPINIIGLTNSDNISQLLESDVTYNYTLLITHEPDLILDLTSYDINTVLSGHNLGGIVDIPFYGGIVKKDGAKTYINDYYKLNDTEIFISNGLGYEKFNFRLFNTPSINVYRFDN